MAKSGNPTKKEAAIISQRNREILQMHKRGYPLLYIAAIFDISKGRVSKIVNKVKGRSKTNEVPASSRGRDRKSNGNGNRNIRKTKRSKSSNSRRNRSPKVLS